jgi:hypothetical protein
MAQIPRELLPDERLPGLPRPENPVHEVGINPLTDAIPEPPVDLETILEITFDIPR